MDWNTMTSVLMSAIFFAPLLLALGFFLFVGALVLFEGAVAFAGRYATETKIPEAEVDISEVGPIAAGLEESVREEVEAGEEKAKKSPATRAANE